MATRGDVSFCSAKCRADYFVGPNAPPWNPERNVVQPSGVLINFGRRIAGPSSYRLEHRVIAEALLGRALIPGDEPILHLDQNKENNDPDNLYLCDSIADMRRILSGAKPYPKKSNLPLFRLVGEHG
jgi:hypothetical protein